MISNKIATKQCFPILHNPNKNLWNNLFDYYASKRDNKTKGVRKAWEIEIDGRGTIAIERFIHRSNDFARWLSNFVRLFTSRYTRERWYLSKNRWPRMKIDRAKTGSENRIASIPPRQVVPLFFVTFLC